MTYGSTGIDTAIISSLISISIQIIVTYIKYFFFVKSVPFRLWFDIIFFARIRGKMPDKTMKQNYWPIIKRDANGLINQLIILQNCYESIPDDFLLYTETFWNIMLNISEINKRDSMYVMHNIHGEIYLELIIKEMQEKNKLTNLTIRNFKYHLNSCYAKIISKYSLKNNQTRNIFLINSLHIKLNNKKYIKNILSLLRKNELLNTYLRKSFRIINESDMTFQETITFLYEESNFISPCILKHFKIFLTNYYDKFFI